MPITAAPWNWRIRDTDWNYQLNISRGWTFAFIYFYKFIIRHFLKKTDVEEDFTKISWPKLSNDSLLKWITCNNRIFFFFPAWINLQCHLTYIFKLVISIIWSCPRSWLYSPNVEFWWHHHHVIMSGISQIQLVMFVAEKKFSRSTFPLDSLFILMKSS